MPNLKVLRLAVAQRVEATTGWPTSWTVPRFLQAPLVVISMGDPPMLEISHYQTEYKFDLTHFVDGVDESYAQDTLSDLMDTESDFFSAFHDITRDDDLGHITRNVNLTTTGGFVSVKIDGADYYYLEQRVIVRA